MITTIIDIRIKQFYRSLKGIGLFRTIFLVGLSVLAAVYIFKLSSEPAGSFYLTAGVVLFVAILHVNRQDKTFLKVTFTRYKFLYFVEYLILVSVVLAFMIYNHQWIPFMVLIIFLCLIIQVDTKKTHNNLNTNLQKAIPSACFEWKAGIRQLFYMVVPLWLLGLFTSFFTASVPVVLLFLGMFPFSFYEKGEPYQMITAFEMSPAKFMMYKIKMHVILFTVLTFPLIAAFIVFYFQVWYIVVIEYFVFISLHIYLILIKYTFYEPNSKSQAAQVLASLGALGAIIPVFLPIVWLMSIRFYYRSNENLKQYLNDFN